VIGNNLKILKKNIGGCVGINGKNVDYWPQTRLFKQCHELPGHDFWGMSMLDSFALQAT
jgi:hypothetical protein